MATQVLDSKDVKMVSINEKAAEKNFGLHGSPLLVHFNGNIPRVFEGDLAEEEEFTKFIEESLEKSDIEAVNGDILDSLVSRLPNIGAVFYDADDENDMEIINKLEDIDDDFDKNGIPFVKIDDVPKARDEFGLDNLPAILFFNDEVPNMFAGDVSDPAALLAWMVAAKAGDMVELVTEEILEDMVDKFEYVVAYFQPYCKETDITCQATRADILAGLEDIRFAPSDIWRPDIELYNSASWEPSASLSRLGTSLVVHSSGSVTWIPPVRLRVICHLDLASLDQQDCELKFGSWTWNGNKVDLQLYSGRETGEADTSTLFPNKEWKLLNAPATRNRIIYECCPEPYLDITFNLRLQRSSAGTDSFTLSVALLPSIASIILVLVSFSLSPRAPEKLGLACFSFLVSLISLQGHKTPLLELERTAVTALAVSATATCLAALSLAVTRATR